MKCILGIIALAASLAVQAKQPFEDCLDLFKDRKPPELTEQAPGRQRDICFDSFAVMHSGESKTPIFVVQRLNSALIADAKGEERKNRFYEEARLPICDRATLDDYEGSGYHRGHMAPAADMPNPNAMAQSFSLANMVPQFPKSNVGPWSKVERLTRRYASRATGDVYIISGPIYDKPAPTIGSGKVWVPRATFKLIYDAVTGSSWAFIVENSSAASSKELITQGELLRQLPSFRKLIQ